MLEVSFDGDTICITEGESMPSSINCKLKTAVCCAYPMTVNFKLQDDDGVWTEGIAGSYIVVDSSGNPSIVSANRFSANYDVV